MDTMSISAILDCPLFRSSFICPPMIMTYPVSNNPLILIPLILPPLCSFNRLEKRVSNV